MLVYTKIGNETLCNYLTSLKIMTEMKTNHLYEICERDDDRLHLRTIKYKIIIIVQYTTAENVPFIFHYHKNYNKSNINHSPS